MNILQVADALIHGERAEEYGHPSENFQDIADGWSLMLRSKLKEPLDKRDIFRCNVITKLCRDRHKKKRDNLVDIAGYAGTAEMVEDVENASTLKKMKENPPKFKGNFWVGPEALKSLKNNGEV